VDVHADAVAQAVGERLVARSVAGVGDDLADGQLVEPLSRIPYCDEQGGARTIELSRVGICP
jgi:hypothetical protein